MKTERLLLTVVTALIGFVAAIYFHHGMGTLGGYVYPQNTFLFTPDDFGNDFFSLIKTLKTGDPYSWPISVYFPLACAFFALFLLLPAKLGFLSFSFLWFATFIQTFFKDLYEVCAERKLAVLSTLVLGMLSYPVLFCLDRGNIEGYVFLLSFIGLHFFAKKKYIPFAILIAVATAAKAYPAMFFLLLLREKRVKELALGGAATLLLMVLPAMFFVNGIVSSYSELLANQKLFHQNYGLTAIAIPYSVSFFSLIKVFVLRHSSAEAVPVVFAYYKILALLIVGAAAALVVFKKELRFWQSLMVIVFCYLCLPQVSFDYKLLHVFIPLIWFLKDEQPLSFKSTWLTPAAAILFGIILFPKNYFSLMNLEMNVSVLTALVTLAVVSAFRAQKNVRNFT